MFQIKDMIGGGAGLAPMAGVTDAAMRVLCAEHGASWAVGEMLSAKGWVFSGGKNQNALDIIKRLPDEGPAGLQLFGSEPEYLARAAAELEHSGFDFIDLNFGCPAPKITGNGEGSAMMRSPEGIARCVRAVVDAVRLPVTAKIRSGWDDDSINAVEVAQICEDSGACAVAVHARTRAQQYSGRADWRVIKAVKRAVSIPVLGNGDVRCGQDAVRMIDETGCDAVIVGRAAQGNPWVFADIAAAMAGRDFVPPTPREKVAMALKHYGLEIDLYGEKLAVLLMRKHIAWYVHGLRGANKFRESVIAMTDAARVQEALIDFAQAQEA